MTRANPTAVQSNVTQLLAQIIPEKWPEYVYWVLRFFPKYLLLFFFLILSECNLLNQMFLKDKKTEKMK